LRLSGSFEAFYSSLAQSAGELWSKVLGEFWKSPCAKILARAVLEGLKILGKFNQKQMYVSAITGKEIASGDWNCIKIFLTCFNI